MKKLILFLLLPLWMLGQTSTGQEQEFDYGIKNNSTQIITTPPFLGTFGTDGTQGKIPAAYIATTQAMNDSLAKKLNISDLPANLTLYPTTTASDVSGYVVLVKDIHDPRYNSTAVNVSTPAITGTAQLISQRISDAGVLTGNPGVFNVTTYGNIRKLSGSGTAQFYFEVYHRDIAGTETLICTSSISSEVVNGTYAEFSASGIWDNGAFDSTDRIVIKTYANRIAGGSDPVYQLQFGGSEPVRTVLPVPFTVLAGEYEIKANKSDSYTTSSSITYASTKALVDGLATKAGTGTPYNSNPYTDKIIIYGNSIETGAGAEPRSVYGWQSIAPQILETKVDNYAISGTTLVKFFDGDNSGIDRLSIITPTYTSDIRAYISGIGVNDMYNINGTYNETNFRTAYNTLIDQLVTDGYPLSKIYLFFPLTANSNTATMNSTVANIALLKGVNFIDVKSAMDSNGGLALVSGDGIHPNNSGHKIIAETISNAVTGTKYGYTQFNQDVSTTGVITAGVGISGGNEANGLEIRGTNGLSLGSKISMYASDVYINGKSHFSDNLSIGTSAPSISPKSIDFGSNTYTTEPINIYNTSIRAYEGSGIGFSSSTGVTILSVLSGGITLDSNSTSNEGTFLSKGTIECNEFLNINKSMELGRSLTGGLSSPAYLYMGDSYANSPVNGSNLKLVLYPSTGLGVDGSNGLALYSSAGGNRITSISDHYFLANVFANNTISANALKLTTTPTASAGSYLFLTYNAATDEVEQTSTVPTQPVGTNNGTIANTAFVQAAIVTGATTIIKQLTPVTHTGTTSQTDLVDILIPANTLASSGVYKLYISASRNSGTGSGADIHAYMTGDSSGAGFVRQLPVGTASNTQAKVEKTIQFQGGNRILHSESGSYYNDMGVLAKTVTSYDTTTDTHLYVGLQLANASDTYQIDYVILKRID